MKGISYHHHCHHSQ